MYRVSKRLKKQEDVGLQKCWKGRLNMINTEPWDK